MWKARYRASYTVEASYIMARVIFALAILIRVSYVQCRETTGQLKLHHMVYRLRGQETEEIVDFTIGQRNGSVNRDQDLIRGSVEEGHGTKEIEVRIHAPEDMMRRMTIFQSEGERVWTR